MKKVVVSWSGGKDSCFAAYQARLKGLEVSYLLNCATEEFKRSSAHGVRVELMKLQAQAIGIPLYQVWVKKNNYYQKFKKAVTKLKREGVTNVVTGDIHLEDSRNWMLKVCKAAGVTPIMPIWGWKSKRILMDFINAGFEAIVVCVKADLLGKEWLGRKIDRDFVKNLSEANPDIDLCGEIGEFHSFVINGPIFKKKVKVSYGKRVLRNDHWFIDLAPG